MFTNHKNRKSEKSLFSGRMLSGAIASVAIMAGVNAAHASIASVTSEVTVIPAPSNLSLGALQSPNEIFAFNEKTNLTLLSALQVSFTAPGGYSNVAELPSPAPKIAARTVVDTYLLHTEPLNSVRTQYSGTITFNEPILGVIISGTMLNLTDALLGHTGTTYAKDVNRGLEFAGPTLKNSSVADGLTLTADHKTIDIDVFNTQTDQDEIRIITAAGNNTVPEPASLGVLGLGAMGLLRRRHRALP